RAEAMKTQAQERITAWVNGESGARAALLLGVREREWPELREAHQNGQTLADLITANGQSVDDFISAVLEPFNARIDRAVENGRITAERAEAMKTQAQERITAWVNGESSASIAMIL